MRDETGDGGELLADGGRGERQQDGDELPREFLELARARLFALGLGASADARGASAGLVGGREAALESLELCAERGELASAQCVERGVPRRRRAARCGAP